MVQAVRDWLNDAVKPHAEGHDKFQVAVAMNALGIVMRDLDAGVRAEDGRSRRRCWPARPALPRPACSQGCAARRSTNAPSTAPNMPRSHAQRTHGTVEIIALPSFRSC